MRAKVLAQDLQEVVAQECCSRRVNLDTTRSMSSSRRTVSRAVRQQDEPEIRMYSDVAIALHRQPYAPAVCEGHFALPGEAAEDGDDVLGRLVGLVYDDESPVFDRAQEGRIGVAYHAALQRGGEHKLGHCGVTMELDVFSGAAQELGVAFKFA